MAQLATWINPAIDSGDRFAEEVAEDLDEPETGDTFGVELDGYAIAFMANNSNTENREHITAIKRVIAAAYEAGREQGRKER